MVVITDDPLRPAMAAVMPVVITPMMTMMMMFDDADATVADADGDAGGLCGRAQRKRGAEGHDGSENKLAHFLNLLIRMKR
jgi:hypothetical protein